MAKRPSSPVDEQPAPSTTSSGTRDLPLVALRETVIFPEMIVPLQVGREKSVNALNAAVARGRRRSRSSPSARPSRKTSTIRPSSTRRHAGQDRPGRAAPGRHGPRDRPGPGAPARRSASRRPSRSSGATIEELPDESPDGLEVQALMRTVQAQIEQYVANGAPVPPEAAVAARNITRARTAGRHGRLQPGHVDRAAPGAARDHRRHRAPQARLQLPRAPDRDPRAQGPDPVRGQVRDGQDPARVHPPRAAQGHPARAG